MRLLWKAHGRASDPVPVLPRGRPAGAIDSPFGAQRPPADTPRFAVHASGGGNLLLCRGIRRAAVASGSDPARGRKLPSAAVVPGRSGPYSLRTLLAFQILSSSNDRSPSCLRKRPLYERPA